MGKAGPPKTPTKILEKRGSRKLYERDTDLEPEAIEEDFACETWVDLEARRMWDELYPKLKQMQILSITDKNILLAYCQTWALWKQSALTIQQQGYKYSCQNGTIRPRPEVKIMKESLDQILRMGAKLGLSPSDRANVQIITEEEDVQQNKLELLN